MKLSLFINTNRHRDHVDSLAVKYSVPPKAVETGKYNSLIELSDSDPFVQNSAKAASDHGVGPFEARKGPLVAKSVAGKMVVVFGSAIYSAMKIRKRVKDSGMMNPTDEVLQAHRQLEASLIGKL
uniref:Uncharacterized protein n=1 Tax=Fagus sylvatica TaxID=28930 RepID=A0A2N9GSG5_FAGSY